MLAVIRVLAVLAGLSALGTVAFIVALVRGGHAGELFSSGPLGVVTGILVFGYGFIYYVVGILLLRSPAASVPQLVLASVVFGVPLAVLLTSPSGFDRPADDLHRHG